MGSLEKGPETVGLEVNENASCKSPAIESVSDGEFNPEGDAHCHSPSCQSQNIDVSTDHEPNKEKVSVEELKLGMEFSSDESAYKAYVEYGRKMGFKVRKNNRKKNKQGIVRKLYYCCSKEGKKRESEGTSYSQPISRVDCQAHMTCSLQNNGKFRVMSFYASHNHDLITPPLKHMLKSNHRMSDAQKAYVDGAEKAGLPIKATILNVKKIPPDYISNRWTGDAKARSITTYHGSGANDNPTESVGKRYSHLCRNFHEIASFAAEHEKLTAYAHDRSVELLKTLEDMKKNLCLEDTCVNQQFQNEALSGGSSASFEVEMSPEACGVKQKATVGRPPADRYKHPLERRKHAPKPKTTKALKRKQQPSEEPTIGARTQGSFSSQTNVAHTGFYDSMPFTQQFQAPYISSQANLNESLPFIQLHQGGSFILYGNDLPQINRGKEFGS